MIVNLLLLRPTYRLLDRSSTLFSSSTHLTGCFTSVEATKTKKKNQDIVYFERDIGLCEHADQDIAYFQETRARNIDFCPSRRSIGFCGSPI